METLYCHYHQWGAVVFFVMVYALAILFVPFYKKADRKPSSAYLAFGMMLEWTTLPLLFMWPFIVWLYTGLAKREERDMLAEFGEEYAQYMDITTRFIPFVV